MSIQFRCRCGTLLTAQRDAQVSSICCPACLEMVPIPLVGDQISPLDELNFLPPTASPAVGGASHETSASESTPFPVGSNLPQSPPMRLTPTRRGKGALARKLPPLIAALTAASLVQLVPVLFYGQPNAPAWMRSLLVISLLQLTFWAWMILVQDWSSLWVATLASASATVFYGFVLAIAVAAPTDAADLLDMNTLRASAQLWAVAMLIMCGALTIACGQLSFQWRKGTRVGF